ncbi:MAG TPA: PilZ domain-containing protein [Spongiibacteraceae bacterium]|jgi:hypothetical protein|nr:PilZ domain-containing protein [Spongiibacteraceae bacterium]HUH38589.1 PilZ domain-containing protein [Spongiibacteraceae bacterium]
MSDERRTETRLHQQATVYVEVQASDYGDATPPRVVVCNSVDISANGLQVRMDDPLPVGTILRLCAEFHDAREPLYLVGEVRWLRQETEGYAIGFSLFEADQSDISGWKSLVASRL